MRRADGETDRAFAYRLLESWMGGTPKSELEREAWGDGRSHGKHFDIFIENATGRHPSEHRSGHVLYEPKAEPDEVNPCWYCNHEVDLTSRPYRQRVVGGWAALRDSGGGGHVGELEYIELYMHDLCYKAWRRERKEME